MFLEKKINELIDNKKTVNVTLIGAGKFGSMFLSQAPYTKGLNVCTICDLNIDKAKNACREVGWSEDQINNVLFTEDFEKSIKSLLFETKIPPSPVEIVFVAYKE